MRPKLFNRKHTRTAHIELDTKRCKACWQCLENCPNQVIDKIELSWHKHALIVAPQNCTGCLKCVHTCPYNAYFRVDKTKEKTLKQKTQLFRNFVINNLLLFSGLAMVLSGLILQVGFHIGGQVNSQDFGNDRQIRAFDTNKTIWDLNYYEWSTVHKVVIVLFSLLMVYHFYIHWNWYKGVLSKRLIGKNIQVITLSTLFLLVAGTGIVPWLIDLSGNTSNLRFILIEIHDKLTLILIIYLILHLIKRTKWFRTAYAKLRN